MELKMAGDQLGLWYEIISQKNYEIGFCDASRMIQGAGAAVRGNLMVTNMPSIRAELFHELLLVGMASSIDQDYFKLSAGKSLLQHRFQPKLFAGAKFMDGSSYGCSEGRHSQSMRNLKSPRAAENPLVRSSSST